MLVTMLISVAGVNRTLLRRLLGGWAFALAFRREVFASLDVSYTAATTLPPSRRCRQIGALLDELQLVTGLCQFVGDKLASRTLRKALRYGRSEGRGRLLGVFCTGGLACLLRVGRGKR